MNNQAKLRVLFNRYSISSKATKNFINYFMNHAKFSIGVDTDGIVREEVFTECNNHEGNNYKFVINNIYGRAASGEHQASEEFNFNIRVESFSEYYDGFSIGIKKDSSTGNVIMNLYYNNTLYMSYTADKTTWTEDKIKKVFPNGLPDGVTIDSIYDFDTRIINEDYFDGTNTKIKSFLNFFGDSFNKESITTTEDEIMIALAGPMILPAGSDVCTVSGTMSNSSTEESIEFNEDIFKLDKVDDSYELNMSSKKEFDTFNLTVKVVPKYDETYAAIVQDDYSHTAGYNFQIPIQVANNYKRGSNKLWHASVDKSVAIGMNFCQVLIGNRKDDEVRLKLIKGDPRASYSIASNEQGYFTFYAVADGADGNKYKLSLSQILNVDVITGVRVEIFENNNRVFANNIYKSPYEDNVVISISDFTSLVDEEDSSKHFTDYLTPAGNKVLVPNTPMVLQLSGGNTTKIIIELYLNNRLYARSFPKQVDRLSEDSYWPATLLMPVFNGSNRGIRMVQFNENGDIVDSNVDLSKYIRLYNYDGEIGYLWLNLNDVESTEITMRPATDYLLAHNVESALVAQLFNKKIDSKLLAFKTMYEYDRDNRYVNTVGSNFNIPVSLKVVSTSGVPLDKDTFPYNKFIDEYDKLSPLVSLKMSKPKDKVEYSLRTPVFTISKPDGSGGYEITNAYYKLGICALDGSNESSENLLNSFIKKSCLTVHQIDYAVNQAYMYYTFAIKPKTEYAGDDLFYSVSEKLQLLDKASIITDRNHLICSTSLRPIVEINSSDQTKNTLLGVLYMDMFNADDDSIITTGWAKNKNIAITIDGISAIDQEILLTKI